MIEMTCKVSGSIAVKRSKFVKILTESMKQVVRGWHENALPEHFESSAPRRYKYKARSRRYQQAKNRRGLQPLEYSGRSKRQLTRTIKPTGSNGLVKGKFVTNSAMRYFWMTPAGHPDKASELVAVAKRETDQIRAAIEKLTAEGVNAVDDKGTIK